MSRSISISFRDETTGGNTSIRVSGSFDVLGGQRSSMSFWNSPRMKEVGIERLSGLGVTDPIIFFGWEDMKLLEHEISLLHEHLAGIDFPVETKAEWLANIVYCYHLLIETAPKTSTPIFSIG